MSRTHLVTGAGSGIGAVLAERLLERGDALVLVARSTERAHDLRAELPDATVLVADLADPLAVEAIADQLPEALDSVVHAAGIVELGPIGGVLHETACGEVFEYGGPGRHPVIVPQRACRRTTIRPARRGLSLQSAPSEGE